MELAPVSQEEPMEKIYDELRMCPTCKNSITYLAEQSCVELSGENREVAMHHVVRRSPQCPLWAKGTGVALSEHEIQQGL